jgi:two-component system, NtrC family, response regulator GlrR
MVPGKILVVDDDAALLEVLKIRLENANFEVMTALTGDDAVEAAKSQVFDLAVVDLQLGQKSGISVMEELHAITPDMPVIILTAYGTIESAVDAMKRGAYNYLTKPFDAPDLLFVIGRALENRRMTTELRMLKGLLKERYDFENIVAKSQKMQQVLEQVSLIAQTDSTVFIHGESGTGKELIAKAIHFASTRGDRPFVALNCAAIPETLLESELFGYEKGAFTGAIRSSKGLFTQAHEGTIFLDEIGDMPLSLQAKLLRVLQERQFYPVGSQRPIEVDVRVVVATNKNLEGEVREGRFREDLFYRIHVIPIRIPPLRERKEDTLPLVEHFLSKFNSQMKKEVKGLTPQSLHKLMLYDWPGNVRELENTIEYAVAMTQQDVITEDYIFPSKAAAPEPLRPLKEMRASFERDYLSNLLALTEGNVSKAAQLAGLYRADLYNLLKKYSLKPDQFKRS